MQLKCIKEKKSRQLLKGFLLLRERYNIMHKVLWRGRNRNVLIIIMKYFPCWCKAFPSSIQVLRSRHSFAYYWQLIRRFYIKLQQSICTKSQKQFTFSYILYMLSIYTKYIYSVNILKTNELWYVNYTSIKMLLKNLTVLKTLISLAP